MMKPNTPNPKIERCLAEIAAAQAHIADHGPEFGAMLGIDDWAFELMLLNGELTMREPTAEDRAREIAKAYFRSDITAEQAVGAITAAIHAGSNAELERKRTAEAELAAERDRSLRLAGERAQLYETCRACIQAAGGIATQGVSLSFLALGPGEISKLKADAERNRIALQGNLDMILADQMMWSGATFGTGERTAGLLAHIRKELVEIEADPHDLVEWVDVILLAMDGYWRHGGDNLVFDVLAKRAINRARTWGPVVDGQPMEHVR